MSPVRSDSRLAVRIVEDFDDPSLPGEAWDRLLGGAPTNVVSLTYDWQRAWWRAFGGDRLLIVLAERGGKLQAIAPLFSIDGTLCFVGSAGSDYLDFIGHPDEETLARMVSAAIDEVPDCAGLNLFHVPAGSPSTEKLAGVAGRLGLDLLEGGRSVAPYLDLTDGARAQAVVSRRRVRRERDRMKRDAEVRFLTAARDQVDEWLEAFFALYDARWGAAGEPGDEGEEDRRFSRAIVHLAAERGWLRFHRLEWGERPVAFEIVLAHGGSHLDYLVARDASITEHSPGKLLESHGIADALRAGARRFDFGLGEEPYKLEHASGVTEVVDWGLWVP